MFKQERFTDKNIDKTVLLMISVRVNMIRVRKRLDTFNIIHKSDNDEVKTP